jgi:transposase InsO family protein
VRLGKVRFEAKYISIQYFYENKGWSIRWMCEQLDITRAAYYKWLHRDIPEVEQENILIAQLIREYDDRFNHILGYRRMTLYINCLNNKQYSKNRIHRIMKVLNIHSVIRRKRKKYQSSTPETTAENLLNRNFYAPGPNQKWSTDVTEFKWYEGPVVHKLYLSVILDLYDLFPVAWVVSNRNDNKLVLDTFAQAILNNPDAKPIFHSDRGFQYTSKVFQSQLQKQGMQQSMSRVGHCIDNGPTENFWSIVKSEMYYLNTFTDEASLRRAIADYMTFYSTKRMQERFRGKTPAEVRAEALATDNPAQYPIPENKRIQKYKARYAA